MGGCESTNAFISILHFMVYLHFRSPQTLLDFNFNFNFNFNEVSEGLPKYGSMDYAPCKKLSLRPTLRTGGSLKLNWSQPECLLRSTQHPLAGIFCQDVLSLSPCCLSPCLPDLFMMCTYLKIFRCAS